MVLEVRRGMKCFPRRSISTGILMRGSGGAFITWFGDRMPCFLRETTVTRVLLGVMCYALKILLRVKYCLSNRR